MRQSALAQGTHLYLVIDFQFKGSSNFTQPSASGVSVMYVQAYLILKKNVQVDLPCVGPLASLFVCLLFIYIDPYFCTAFT